MKLTEVKNEEAIDMLADLIEPLATILADKELAGYLSKGDRLKAVRHALKHHKQTVLEILAIMDGVPVEEYECNVLTLPLRLLEILNNKTVASLFM